MIIVLNGPLGIGKSTLAEALMESIDGCAMIDGDRLAAVNPPHRDALDHLHAAMALLVAHHRAFGYRHFVIDHYWRSAAELADLRRRLAPAGDDFRCFVLTLPVAENLRRIERRASARAIDEIEFERQTVDREREELSRAGDGLGEPFDVSAPPEELVPILLRRLGLR
jgi:hypothetical protein